MNEIRIGRVSSVNYDAGSVDVVFLDEEETVCQDCSMMSNEYRMPKINQMVLVVFKTNSRGADEGYVIGVPFSAENMPEEKGKDVYYMRFSEEAYVYYDAAKETLHFHAPKIIIDNLKE